MPRSIERRTSAACAGVGAPMTTASGSQRERLVERQCARPDARGQDLRPFHVEIGDDELA